MKTDSKAMAALFDKFAEVLKDTVENGKTVVDKEGELQSITPDAATLNVVRQFLKDQNVSVVPGTNDVVNDLAKSLPFDGSEYDEEEIRH
jgi:ferritin